MIYTMYRNEKWKLTILLHECNKSCIVIYYNIIVHGSLTGPSAWLIAPLKQSFHSPHCTRQIYWSCSGSGPQAGATEKKGEGKLKLIQKFSLFLGYPARPLTAGLDYSFSARPFLSLSLSLLLFPLQPCISLYPSLLLVTPSSPQLVLKYRELSSIQCYQ